MSAKATLENIKPEIIEILDEMATEHISFFHIEINKVMEIIDLMGVHDELKPALNGASTELLRFIVKEELIVFAKRHNQVITHKECSQIITRSLSLTLEAFKGDK